MFVPEPVTPIPDFLLGGGHMGQLIRAFAWQGSSLGPVSHWSQPLRTALRLLLNSRHPMLLLWGEQQLCFYNDAYSESLGPEQHPALLGQSLKHGFPEFWSRVASQVETVMQGGGGSFSEDQRIEVVRHGRREQVWWSVSHAPVDDEQATGQVGGVLTLCTETTRRVLAERRLAFQLRLSDSLRELEDASTVDQLAARLLGEQLNADRAGYAEIEDSDEWAVIRADWTRGYTRSIVGRHHLADFGPRLISALRAGRVGRLNDTRLDALAGSGGFAPAYLKLAALAAINVPIIRNGRFAAVMFVHQCEPRCWTDEEVALVVDAAERTFEAIQRGRAEAALQARERQLAELNETLELQVDRILAERKFMADIIELNAAPIVAVDPEFGLLALNRAYAHEFQRRHGVLPHPGDNLMALLEAEPALRELERWRWNRAVHGEHFKYTESPDELNPEAPWYEYSYNLLKDREGRVIGAVQYGRDLSAQGFAATAYAQQGGVESMLSRPSGTASPAE